MRSTTEFPRILSEKQHGPVLVPSYLSPVLSCDFLALVNLCCSVADQKSLFSTHSPPTVELDFLGQICQPLIAN